MACREEPPQELTPEERLARSRSRKRRRAELSNKGTLAIVDALVNNGKCQDFKKCLLNKLVSAGFLDDQTESEVVHWLDANAVTMLKAVQTCIAKNDANGLEYIKAIVDASNQFEVVSTVYKTTYTSLVDPEHKCIFWALSAAFAVIFYELSTDEQFSLPLPIDSEDFSYFLKRYPEFLSRTWDFRDLYQFKICMCLTLRAFGSKSNMAATVELVTFMVKGRDVALCANTSGGGLKEFDRPTEVSTEKCRVLMYHRESGSTPRKRKARTNTGGGDMENTHNLGMAVSAYWNAMAEFRNQSNQAQANMMNAVHMNAMPVHYPPHLGVAYPVPIASHGPGLSMPFHSGSGMMYPPNGMVSGAFSQVPPGLPNGYLLGTGYPPSFQQQFWQQQGGYSDSSQPPPQQHR